MESFEGKIAVVTGGAGGMGRQIVIQLAAAGCSVAACDLNAEALAETAELARAGAPAGVRITSHRCDITDETSVEAFRAEVLEQHDTQHVNLLFNNAGITGNPSFVSGERRLWDRIFAVNWTGVYNCSRAFVPLLVASDGGCLVNTSSVSGFWANESGGAYCAAKYAVKGFSEALIEDFRTSAPHVEVAVVMPGVIDTGIAANSVSILDASAREVLGDLRVDVPDPDEMREGTRLYLSVIGLPVDHVADDLLGRAAGLIGELFPPTSAAEAATIILNGVREGRWRILVGEDAGHMDAALRADPEAAYVPGGSSRIWRDPDLVASVLLLCGVFESVIDASAIGSYALRIGASWFAYHMTNRGPILTRRRSSDPDATMESDSPTLRAILSGRLSVDSALRDGRAIVGGDIERVRRLLPSVSAA